MSRLALSDPYPIISPPPLSMSELICKTLNDDIADMLIDKWLENRHDTYFDWFYSMRERRNVTQCSRGQMLAWNKGNFVPENFFCRTVDTGRVVPLDRTWMTYVYYHKSMLDRELSMAPVVYTMLPELMLLRGMHDHGCDSVYVIVCNLTRDELDDVTEYFKLVCRVDRRRSCKPNLERKIRREHKRITQTLRAQQRLPCFPQIDITFRGILHEKNPPFIIIFSHHSTSYSQIFFTQQSYVPEERIFYNFPSGCPNPDCDANCEMLRLPRKGLETAVVLPVQPRPLRSREMCNWVDCGACFSFAEEDGAVIKKTVPPMKCSKCKLVSYCSAAHQRLDWSEHRRLCVKVD